MQNSDPINNRNSQSFSSSQCPNPRRLSQYVEGGLTLLEHEKVESHIDQCNLCNETIQTMDASVQTRLGKLISNARSDQNAKPGLAPNGDAMQPETTNDDTLDLMAQRAKQVWNTKEKQDTSQHHMGDTIGNYVLSRPLGKGNMGHVVLASHTQMKREVALKFISPELLTSPAARTRFQREIEATAKLQHPNLVIAHDAGEVNGQHFLVMEYVRGTDLRSKVKKSGPLDITTAMQCTADAARGLYHAHEKGIIHRDVKPGNIMLDSDFTAKVTDLGLARCTDTDTNSVEVSQTGLVLGTAAFMSPEQCAGARDIDFRTDIYSLGCTLFYLLTGRNVYESDSTLQMLRLHAEAPIPAVRKFRPECSQELEDLLSSMLSKRPQDRPESMQVVATRLDELVKSFEPSQTSASVAAVETRPRTLPILAGLFTIAIIVYTLSSFPTRVMRELSNSLGWAAGGTAAIEIEMQRIPAGKFMMGASASEKNAFPNELPQHEVQLTHDFLLGKFEITTEQFNEVMKTSGTRNGIEFVEQTEQPSGAVPVSGITWFEAIRFCNQLSTLQGLQPYYKIHGEEETVSIRRGSDGYRLPTEAEWEYACRAGTQTPWYFGDSTDNINDFAWHSDNADGQTQVVGQKEPNGFGLHDMLGNVPEWCWDRFDEAYYLKSEAINPPGSTKGDQRVFRGGGVNHNAAQLRASTRNPLGTQYGFSNGVGLRVARNVPLSL